MCIERWIDKENVAYVEWLYQGLARIWNNCHALLGGTYKMVPQSLWESLAVSQKVKYIPIIWPSYSTPRNLPKKKESVCPHKEPV